jgi:two-component system, LytTR family, sensor kinase
VHSIGFHVIGWNLFVFLNFLLINRAGLKFEIARQVEILTIYVVVFYVIYFLIAPLLLKKRLLWFVITLVVVTTSAVLIYHTIQQHHHAELMGEIRKERNEIFHEGIEREMSPKGKGPPFARGNFHVKESIMQVLFFVLVSLLLRFAQKWQFDEKAKYVLEKEKSDAELLFLKQQINPHFLFNSLNT